MENQIRIINTSYHKHMTDRHLAQVNFTAIIPTQLWEQYIEKTNIDKQSLGRIRFMEICDSANPAPEGTTRVFGRVSHGYGYDISQDIAGAIEYSKGVKK
jgi:hypothetical protein